MLAVIVNTWPALPWEIELFADSDGKGLRMVTYRTMVKEKIGSQILPQCQGRTSEYLKQAGRGPFLAAGSLTKFGSHPLTQQPSPCAKLCIA